MSCYCRHCLADTEENERTDEPVIGENQLRRLNDKVHDNDENETVERVAASVPCMTGLACCSSPTDRALGG